MIYLKIIISCFIIFICSYIGYIKADKLKKREYILKDMVTFLNLLKNEIIYNMSYLPNAYEISRQKLLSPLKDTIGAICIDMLKNDSYTFTKNSIEKNISLIDELTDYDKSVISSTLNNLGKSDLPSQENIIENCIRILDVQIKEAEDIKNTNYKMYQKIGIISGIMIVVIFI